jgi:hypothetical protein
MNQIEQAIRDLSSPDKNTRYEACVELRLADSIPEPAIAALEAATHDPRVHFYFLAKSEKMGHAEKKESPDETHPRAEEGANDGAAGRSSR